MAGIDAPLVEVAHFLQQYARIDGHTVTYHAGRLSRKDAGRNEMEGKLSQMVNDGVPGVIPAGQTDDIPGFFRQHVHDLPFTLIPPLRPDNGDYRHHPSPNCTRLFTTGHFVTISSAA